MKNQLIKYSSFVRKMNKYRISLELNFNTLSKMNLPKGRFII